MAKQTAEMLRALAARDRFMQALGMELVDAGPGRASVSITVREEHLKFNGTCHGGVLLALADSAFGLSSNSHAAVAAGIDAHIAYPAAARLGDTLTASAGEVTRSSRLATYRVAVSGADGRIVAVFAGAAFITEDAHDAPGRP
jgi:acyl-CoA thioesterase